MVRWREESINTCISSWLWGDERRKNKSKEKEKEKEKSHLRLSFANLSLPDSTDQERTRQSQSFNTAWLIARFILLLFQSYGFGPCTNSFNELNPSSLVVSTWAIIRITWLESVDKALGSHGLSLILHFILFYFLKK